MAIIKLLEDQIKKGAISEKDKVLLGNPKINIRPYNFE